MIHINNEINTQYITNNTLTTDVWLKLTIYALLLGPLGVFPPNNMAQSLVNDVKVKELIGGGLSPVRLGELHLPNNNR